MSFGSFSHREPKILSRFSHTNDSRKMSIKKFLSLCRALHSPPRIKISEMCVTERKENFVFRSPRLSWVKCLKIFSVSFSSSLFFGFCLKLLNSILLHVSCVYAAQRSLREPKSRLSAIDSNIAEIQKKNIQRDFRIN